MDSKTKANIMAGENSKDDHRLSKSFDFFKEKLFNSQTKRPNLTPILETEEVKNELNMSPLQKLFKQRKFPFKLFLHVLLLFCLFVQVFLYTSKKNLGIANSTKFFVKTFLPEGYETMQENTVGYYTYYFTEINEVVSDVTKTVETYYNLVDNSPDVFLYFPENSRNSATLNITKPLDVDIQLFKTNIRDLMDENNLNVFFFESSVDTFSDVLSKTKPLGEKLADFFSDAQKTRTFFDRLKFFSISFAVQSLNMNEYIPGFFGYDIIQCTEWKIVKKYDFEQRGGSIALQLMYSFGPCSNSALTVLGTLKKLLKPITWFNIFTYLLSLLSFFLNCKAIYSRLSLFTQLQKFKKKQEKEMNELKEKKEKSSKKREKSENNDDDFEENDEEIHKSFKLLWKSFWSFFSSFTIPGTSGNVKVVQLPEFLSIFWVTLTLVGDISNAVACVSNLCNNAYDLLTSFVMGLGIVLTFSSTVRYFKWYPEYYALVLTFQRAFKNIIFFFVGAFPLFFGYVLFGTIVFGHYSPYFENMDASAATLFSLINGDAIHAVFDMLWAFNPFSAVLSRFFLYSFIMIFICVVLNVFVLIMEDSFFMLSGEIKKEKENQKKLQTSSKIQITSILKNDSENEKNSVKNLNLNELMDEEVEHTLEILEKEKKEMKFQKREFEMAGRRSVISEAYIDTLLEKNQNEKNLQFVLEEMKKLLLSNHSKNEEFQEEKMEFLKKLERVEKEVSAMRRQMNAE